MPTILITITLVVAVIGLILILLVWQKVKQPVG